MIDIVIVAPDFKGHLQPGRYIKLQIDPIQFAMSPESYAIMLLESVMKLIQKPGENDRQ